VAAAPKRPLSRGVVNRFLGQPTNTAPTNAATIVRAYITPRHPEGVAERYLKAAPPELQIETAEFWFLSNFQPAPVESRNPGLFAYGQNGGYAPSNRHVPTDLLREEFGSSLDIALTDLAERLRRQSDFWEPIAEPFSSRSPGSTTDQ
jgi:hypothetical protein